MSILRNFLFDRVGCMLLSARFLILGHLNCKFQHSIKLGLQFKLCMCFLLFSRVPLCFTNKLSGLYIIAKKNLLNNFHTDVKTLKIVERISNKCQLVTGHSSVFECHITASPYTKFRLQLHETANQSFDLSISDLCKRKK